MMLQEDELTPVNCTVFLKHLYYMDGLLRNLTQARVIT